MHDNHVIFGKGHFFPVQDIKILHPHIVVLIEEAFPLYPCHVQDVQVAHGVLKAFYFPELDMVFSKHVFPDIAWDAEFFRGNQDKLDMGVTD